MDHTETLVGVAEISLGLAGFSGIVTVLQFRGSWHPWDAFRTTILLIIGFGALILSLIPVAIQSFGVSGTVVWRMSSAVMLTYLIISTIVGQRLMKPLATEAIPHFRSVMAVFWGITATNCLIQLLNALAVGIPGVFAGFFLGLLCLLLLGAIQFVAILLIRPR